MPLQDYQLKSRNPAPTAAVPTPAVPEAAPEAEVVEADDLPMTAEGYWAWSTAAWLTILSLPMIVFPRLLVFLSETEHRDTLTSFEGFLSVQFGVLLLSLALALAMAIPAPSPVPSPAHRPNVPPTHPLLVPLTIALLISCFVAFNTSPGRVGPIRILVYSGNAAFGLFGLWVIVFGGGGHISRTTGADKRTSAFMFGNKNAASKIKKAWRKERDTEVKDYGLNR